MTCAGDGGNFSEKTPGQYSTPIIKVIYEVLFFLLLSHLDAALLGTMKIQTFTGKSPHVL